MRDQIRTRGKGWRLKGEQKVISVKDTHHLQTMHVKAPLAFLPRFAISHLRQRVAEVEAADPQTIANILTPEECQLPFSGGVSLLLAVAL